MSQSVTVIGGTNNGHLSGLINIPISGVPSSQFTQIQNLLTGLSTSIESGTIGLFNDNLTATNQVSGAITIGAATVGSSVLELSNTDSTGGVTSGSVSISSTIPSSYTTIIAEAPGTMSLTGATTGGASYVFGANTNVNLTSYGSNTIYAGGGADTLNPGSGSASITYTSGNSSVNVQSGSSSVAATGNATVSVHVASGFSGTINFVNSSSAAANVNAGTGSATVFGGSAGGMFQGGTAGNNSLVGGTGSAFLIGGGNDDVIQAGMGTTSGSGTNFLFSGVGNETLFASSQTKDNLLAGGSGADSIVSEGSGNQYFFASNGSTTMTGSTVTGAKNTYFFGGPASTTGGNDLITNFSTSRDGLNVLGGANIQSITQTTLAGQPGALVTLSDGTHVTMLGINATNIQGSVGGKSIA